MSVEGQEEMPTWSKTKCDIMVLFLRSEKFPPARLEIYKIVVYLLPHADSVKG